MKLKDLYWYHLNLIIIWRSSNTLCGHIHNSPLRSCLACDAEGFILPLPRLWDRPPLPLLCDCALLKLESLLNEAAEVTVPTSALNPWHWLLSVLRVGVALPLPRPLERAGLPWKLVAVARVVSKLPLTRASPKQVVDYHLHHTNIFYLETNLHRYQYGENPNDVDYLKPW